MEFIERLIEPGTQRSTFRWAVDLGAQRVEAGLKVYGVKLDGPRSYQRREASSTLATMHGCLREPFIGNKQCLDPQTPRHERFDTHH